MRARAPRAHAEQMREMLVFEKANGVQEDAKTRYPYRLHSSGRRGGEAACEQLYRIAADIHAGFATTQTTEMTRRQPAQNSNWCNRRGQAVQLYTHSLKDEPPPLEKRVRGGETMPLSDAWAALVAVGEQAGVCLLYTSPSPRD